MEDKKNFDNDLKDLTTENESNQNREIEILKLDNHNNDENTQETTYFEEHLSLENKEVLQLDSGSKTINEDQLPVLYENNDNEEATIPEVEVININDHESFSDKIIIDADEKVQQNEKKSIFKKWFKKKTKQNSSVSNENNNSNKKRKNSKVLFIILGFVIVLAGVNFGLKMFKGQDLIQMLTEKQYSNNIIAVQPHVEDYDNFNGNNNKDPFNGNKQTIIEPFNPNPEEIYPPNDSFDVGIDNGQDSSFEEDPFYPLPMEDPVITQLKSELEFIESDAKYLDLKFNLESVEMIEPTVFVKGSIGAKKADILSLNRLVREIQTRIHKMDVLNKPYTKVQVVLIKGSNLYTWETHEKVISFVSKLNFEDRHSTQMWWERSTVTLNGENYKKTLSRINLYVPAPTPIWPKDQTENEEGEEDEEGDETDPSDEQGKDDDKQPNSNSSNRLCTNDTLNTNNNCKFPAEEHKDKFKDYYLAFTYPSAFEMSFVEEKYDNINAIGFESNGKPTENDFIQSLKVIMFDLDSADIENKNLFNIFTNVFEANHPELQYTKNDGPVDLNYLSKNGILTHGRVYEYKDKNEGNIFLIVGSKDDKGYVFIIEVKDYLLSSVKVFDYYRNVELGKPEKKNEDNSANSPLFFNPETGNFEFRP